MPSCRTSGICYCFNISSAFLKEIFYLVRLCMQASQYPLVHWKKKGIDIYNLCAYQDFENFDYCILILQKQWTGPFCVSPFLTCFWYTFTIESSNFNRNHITFIIDTPWLSDSCIMSISWSLFLFKLKFLLSHILETLYSYEVVERCETTKVNLFCRGQEE